MPTKIRVSEKTQSENRSEGLQLVSLRTGIGDMAFGRDELLTEADAGRKRTALHHFQAAYEAQMRGDLDAAADLYKRSIDAYPTAEAHTFLGWTYSFLGSTDEAIEECRRAIEVDSDFGNPYNDIGAYLIEKGDLEEAIAWLNRAMNARRYECYFYPHFNLGRIHQAKGRYSEAMREYKTAIELNPKYTVAIRAFRRLQAMLN